MSVLAASLVRAAAGVEGNKAEGHHWRGACWVSGQPWAVADIHQPGQNAYLRSDQGSELGFSICKMKSPSLLCLLWGHRSAGERWVGVGSMWADTALWWL